MRAIRSRSLSKMSDIEQMSEFPTLVWFKEYKLANILVTLPLISVVLYFYRHPYDIPINQKNIMYGLKLRMIFYQCWLVGEYSGLVGDLFSKTGVTLGKQL